MTLTFSNDDIKLINLFSSFASGTAARDCFINGNSIVFLVDSQDIGKAIGKQGANVKRMSARMNKRIEILEYDENPEGFMKKAFRDLKFQDVKVVKEGNEKKLEISLDYENKQKMLQNSQKLKLIKGLIERNFNITQLKIR